MAFLENVSEQSHTILNDSLNLFEESHDFNGGMVPTRSTTMQRPKENEQMHRDKFRSIIKYLLENLKTRSKPHSDLEEIERLPFSG